MTKRDVPDGGRYTRPRRGFRSRSNYHKRLAKRGLSKDDVLMQLLNDLRKRQGYQKEAS